MKYLRSVPFKIRLPLYLLALAFVTAVAFAIPFPGLDSAQILIAGAILVVAWEAFIYHKGVIPLLVVHLAQAIVVGIVIAYFFSSIAPYVDGVESVNVLVTGLNIVAGSSVVLMLLGTLAVYTVTIGRAWVNMALAYVLADVTFFALILAEMEVPVAAMIGAGVGFAYLAGRVFLPLKKDNNFNWKIIQGDKRNTVLEGKIEAQLKESGYLVVDGVGASIVGTAKGRTIVAMPVAGDLRVNRTSLTVDDRDISSVFHELLEESESHHPSRWKRNNVSLLLVTPSKKDRRSVLTVRSKRYPNRLASQAFIVSENRLEGVLAEL